MGAPARTSWASATGRPGSPSIFDAAVRMEGTGRAIDCCRSKGPLEERERTGSPATLAATGSRGAGKRRARRTGRRRLPARRHRVQHHPRRRGRRSHLHVQGSLRGGCRPSQLRSRKRHRAQSVACICCKRLRARFVLRCPNDLQGPAYPGDAGHGELSRAVYPQGAAMPGQRGAQHPYALALVPPSALRPNGRRTDLVHGAQWIQRPRSRAADLGWAPARSATWAATVRSLPGHRHARPPRRWRRRPVVRLPVRHG